MKKENVTYDEEVYAIIFYSHSVQEGVHFYTQNTNTLQVGKQLRKKDTIIPPHRHNAVKTESFATQQEVLIVEQGKLKVNFFDEDWNSFESKILESGDMILLIKGGHGFEILEDTVLTEIKQGPYNPAATERVTNT